MSSLRLDEFNSIEEFMEAVKAERRGYSIKDLWNASIVVACIALAILLLTCCVAFAGDLSPHFSYRDFRCHHCGELKLDPKLLDKLETLRHIAGDRKIYIACGYRCKWHNEHLEKDENGNWIKGAKYSQHLQGKAADMRIEGLSKNEVIVLAKRAGFTFIMKSTGRSVHVDVRSK